MQRVLGEYESIEVLISRSRPRVLRVDELGGAAPVAGQLIGAVA